MPTDETSQPAGLRRPRPLRWIVALLVFVAAAAGGVVTGLSREPVYTATVDVGIGTGGLTGNSVPAYAQAARTLAANYARTIQSPAIVDPIARAVGARPVAIEAHVSASPIPESSIIRVTVTGDRDVEVVRTANVAAKTFSDAITEQIAGASDLVPLESVEEAQLRVLRAARTVRRLRNANVSRNTDRYIRAETEEQVRRTRLRALTTRYEESRSAPTALTSDVVRAARTASSDRKSTFLLYTALGILLGSVLAFGAWNVIPARRPVRAG